MSDYTPPIYLTADVASVIVDAFLPRSGQTVSGYGGKVPTRYRMALAGSPRIMRRVYAMSYGNSATYYVLIGRKVHLLASQHEHALEDAR